MLVATTRTSTSSTTGGANNNNNGDKNAIKATSSSKSNRKPSRTAAKLPGLHAAEQKQVVKRTQETTGMKITERVAERVAETAAERTVAKAAASKALAAAGGQEARSIGKHAVVRTASRTASPQQELGITQRLLLPHFPANLAAKRLARGILIGVPVVGAALSAWLARSDMRRTYQEIAIARSDHARALARASRIKHTHGDLSPTVNTGTVNCFGVATAADSVNVVAHLITAFGLYQGWEPDPIAAAESASLLAAVVSTGAAVGGEYLSARRATRLEMEAEAGDDECRKGQSK